VKWKKIIVENDGMKASEMCRGVERKGRNQATEKLERASVGEERKA